MEKIDVVVPYVDSIDPEWQKVFNEYNPKKELDEQTNGAERFRGQGNFFKYWFRCIAKNLPWVNNVFLLVQSDSQVPDWVDRSKVKVVLHKEFIPEEYLPTFNSTCIEMFLWNIKELCEQFIYFNDDVFITKPITQDLFFKDGKVRNNTKMTFDLNNIYGHHRVNTYALIYNANKEEIMKTGQVISVSHIARPYLKSEMINCFNQHKDDILNSISKFREEKNLNVFLFDHYIIKNNKQLYRVGIIGKTINSKSSVSTINSILNSIKTNIVCIQDTAYDIDIYKNPTIVTYFIQNYIKVSKYELGYKQQDTAKLNDILLQLGIK
jgi:hypothetical protein